MQYSSTMLYAGVLALILVVLSLRLVRMRRRLRVGLGSGGNDELQRQVRAHANFCEYVPMALVLMLLLESAGSVTGGVLHGLGIALVAGRILHGFFGVNRHAGTSFGRFWGTFLTWLVILVAGAWLLYLAVGRLLAG